VRGCSFYGNTQYAINNTGNSFCVNAEGNWWGAASGPNDASATADLCGLGANAGTGDKVSNNVDYLPYATGGIQTALLGDVSLNGQVLAYDASLVLQYVVALITLDPLQQLVADVSGAGGITAFDGSLILQWVAGIIRAFPAASNAPGVAAADVLAARELVRRATGAFTVSLGEAWREGDEWVVPVRVIGTAPVYAVELRLEGEGAAALRKVAVDAAGALAEHGVGRVASRVAVAALQPLGADEALLLRFAATGETWVPPALAWARVNEAVAALGPGPSPAPAVSFLGRPLPNPAGVLARLSLGIAADEAGARVTLRVLDLAGRQVRTLLDAALPAGRHTVSWDLRDEGGRAVPAGVYLVQAQAERFATSRRVVVVR
jgi:hypothetical protein